MKDMGLVTQVFDERRLASLHGHLAIGHNRYSTTGSSSWMNAQPIYRSVGDAGLRARSQRQPHQHRGACRGARDAAGDDRRRDPVRLHHRFRARRRADRTRVADRTALGRSGVGARAREGVAAPRGWLLVRADGRQPADRRARPARLLAARAGSARRRRLGPRERVGRARHRRRALHPRRQPRRDGGDRRIGLPPRVPVRRTDAAAVSLRVRVLLAAGHPSVRPERARGAPTDGRGVGAAVADRRRHGDAGSRIGDPGRPGLRPGVGDPLRRRSREEPLRRPYVHPAEPAATRHGRAHEVEPAAREHPREAAGGRRRFDRAGHHHAPGGRDAARGRCGRGALPRVVAAVPLPVLLRHGHRPPRRAARRGSLGRRDPRLPRRRFARVPRSRPADARDARVARTSFCTACLSADYPVPVELADRRREARARGPHHGRPHVAGRRDRPSPSPTRRPGSTSRRAIRPSSSSRITRAPRTARASSAAIGGFGGLFDLGALDYRDPILVSSTDGVGTKSVLAWTTGRYDTIGIDLVGTADDIAAQGAEPLFFFDYLSMGQLDPDVAGDHRGRGGRGVSPGRAPRCSAARCRSTRS